MRCLHCSFVWEKDTDAIGCGLNGGAGYGGVDEVCWVVIEEVSSVTCVCDCGCIRSVCLARD